MTLTTTTSRVDYGATSATTFAVPFKFLLDSDLVVTRTDSAGAITTLTLNTDYTVTGAGSTSGSITYAAHSASDLALTIRRIVPLTQEVVLPNQGAFFPATHEAEFDKLTMLAQQLQEESDRSLKVAANSTAVVTLPAVVAGEVIGFNLAGTGLSTYPVTNTAATTLQADLASTASAALGDALVGVKQSNTAGVLAGAVARTVHSKLSDYVSIKDFGADPANTAAQNDTAIAAAVAHAKTINGTVYIPAGNYLISATISYTSASAGDGINLVGESSFGSVLSWAGSSSDVAIHWKGANMFRMENFRLSVSGAFRYFGGIRLQEQNSIGGPSSANGVLRNLYIYGGTGVGSYGIRLGDNNYQLSEMVLDQVIVAGVDAAGTTEYGVITSGAGNTKNFRIYNGGMSGCKNGLYIASSPGYVTLTGVSFSVSTVTDIFIGDGKLSLVACGSEGSACFLTTTGGNNNPPIVSLISCYVDSAVFLNDIAINIGSTGKLSLIGNTFHNQAAGPKTAIINTGGDGSLWQTGSIFSRGNWYINATGHSPFYTESGVSVWSLYGNNVTGFKMAVDSYGDMGGTTSAGVPLTPMLGESPSVMEVATYGNQFGVAGFTYAGPSFRRAVTSVVMDKSVWTAASTTQGPRVFQLLNGYALVGVIVRTTEAYAGLAGTIQLRVGVGASAQDLILAHDVKTAAVTKGTADADLGTAFVRSAVVQGGIINFTGSSIDINVTLVSGTGNIGTGTVTNLSAGSTTLYIITEKYV